MNKVILMGNLGADPELRYTQSGKAVLKINMGTKETWNDPQGNRQEKTTWHQVLFWDKRAEGLARVLTKGAKVLVTGKISNRTYEKDGQTRYISEVSGEDLEFCGPRPQQQQQYQQQPAQHSGHQQSVQQQQPVQPVQPVQQQPVQPVQQQRTVQQQQPVTQLSQGQRNQIRNPNQNNPPLAAQNFPANTSQHPDPAAAPGLDEIPF